MVHGLEVGGPGRAHHLQPAIFGGKPSIRGHRLAVEHVLGMLAAGDTTETVLAGYSWTEHDDVQADLAYATRVVGRGRFVTDPPTTS